MKNKPRWMIKDSSTAVHMIIRNPSNADDCEVFVIKIAKEGSLDRFIFNGCVEATKRITELMDRGNYFKNKIFNYSEKKGIGNGSVTSGIGISIPSQRRAKQLDNRFELLAEILAMNGVNFSRPAMGVINL